jgi:hypothetical protein
MGIMGSMGVMDLVDVGRGGHWWTTWTGGEWASVGVGMQAAGGGCVAGGGFEI